MNIAQRTGQLYAFVRVAEYIGSNTTCVGRMINKQNISVREIPTVLDSLHGVKDFLTANASKTLTQ
jgi:hypothetical protein